ncbi:MAG: hypothetical protein KAJ39_08930, partial [Gammaproteobacteria bacterium]|nr:hypothetical protein [Gammaproteobacteria bacterium]
NPVQRIHQEWIFELKLSDLDALHRCPACRRKGNLKTTPVYDKKEEVDYWDVVCDICRTKGKLINDTGKVYLKEFE